MPTYPSACPLDCPDACSLDVDVQDGRVVALDGSERNPLTRGFICGKVRDFPKHLYGNERLRHPALRDGRKGEGRFRRVSWDEALSTVAGKLAEVRERFGGEAILPYCYGGSNGFLTQGTVDARFFHRLGASTLLRTLCAAPTGRAAVGLAGKMAGVALTDYVHARLIVLWGANPSASNIHLVPFVQEAQRHGAKLVVVDPRTIPLARTADLHLAPRPGTDLVLALAMIREIFRRGAEDRGFLAQHTTGAEVLRERAEPWTLARAADVAGVPETDLEQLVDLYVATHPAVIRCGWGPERNRNGGSATAAILALPAVAGKLGVRGGGFTMSNSGVWKLDAARAAAAPAPATRPINMSRLGEALLDLRSPPVMALFVYDSNPAATTPHQTKVIRGLEREDLFTVVHDQVMTATARYADVILPATTFLEHEELARGYGAMVLQHARPVIPPVGEARPNHEVFAELCRRMELAIAGDPSSPAELVAALLPDGKEGQRLRSALEADGIAEPATGHAPIQFVDAFPQTPDRKMHLVPEELDREAPRGLYAYLPDPGSARYPLAMISPATSRTISSTFGHLHAGVVPLEMCPEDAWARGLADGDRVRVFNDLGEVVVPLRVSPLTRAGVVVLPKGLWPRNTLNGATANALAPDTLADLGGGACYNDARVEVARVEA